MKDPARRDPRVYVIPADQPDFPTATKFINTLRYIGVEVHQASAPFSANSKTYPAGSYVVKTAQAGRAHVIDMFEPQDHPNDMDERGIPRRPYDNAGWTLSYQMGVKVDRLFDDVTGPFKEIQGLAAPVPGRISGTAKAGYLLSPSINDSFTVANRVLKANGDVYRLDAPMTDGGKTYPAGSLYVDGERDEHADRAEGGAGARREHRRHAAPLRQETRLATKRIALWDTPDRLDALRLDAFPARALRVPLHGRVRSRFRRLGAALEVRRDHHAVGRGASARAVAVVAAVAVAEAVVRRLPAGTAKPSRSRSAQPLRGDDRHRHRRDGRSQRPEVRRGRRRGHRGGIGGGVDCRVAAAAGRRTFWSSASRDRRIGR